MNIQEKDKKKKIPLAKWEKLELKIMDKIDENLAKKRKPGRPKKNAHRNEITVHRLRQAVIDLNAPEHIISLLKGAGRHLSWSLLHQMAMDAFVEHKEVIWADAIIGIVTRHNCGTTLKNEITEDSKWDSLNFCDYCWRLAPRGGRGTYLCSIHNKPGAARMRAYRSTDKVKREKIKLRKKITRSNYFSNGAIDFEKEGWLEALFPIISKTIDQDFPNIQTTPEDLKNSMTLDKLLEIIIFLDDNEDRKNMRSQAHLEMLKSPTLLFEFFLLAEAWQSVYIDNINNWGGSRKKVVPINKQTLL